MTRVVFEVATLADAIKKAERIAPNKGQAFDKAAGIILEIDPEFQVIICRATNLDIFHMEWLDCVEMEGNKAIWRLPSRIFAGTTSSLAIGSGKQVTLEEKVNGKSRQLHLTAGRTKCRFNLLDESYFPQWDAFDPDGLFPCADLGGRIAQVEWAAAKTEAPISGVHFDGEQVVSTDKYRLARAPLAISDLKEPVTVPAGILGQILKTTGEVMIGVEGEQFLMMPDEHTQMRCVIYGQTYPNVSRAMSRDYPNSVTLNKVALLEIISRSLNFTGANRYPTLELYIGGEEVGVVMREQEVGMIGDVVEVPGQASHDRHCIKFTPKNIQDGLDNAPNDQVTIHYDTAKANRLVYIDGGTGYEAWIMPRADKGEVKS